MQSSLSALNESLFTTPTSRFGAQIPQRVPNAVISHSHWYGCHFQGLSPAIPNKASQEWGNGTKIRSPCENKSPQPGEGLPVRPPPSSTTTSINSQASESHEATAHKARGYEAPNLWKEAFDTLDEKEQRLLKPSNAGSSDESENVFSWNIEKALDAVIDTTRRHLEIRELKRKESRVGDYPQRILSAVLVLKDSISAVLACDPTGHASAAWSVVSMGLNITQNYCQQQETWLESSEYLSSTISRITLVETTYRDKNRATKKFVEDALVGIYVEVLRYAAAARAIHQSNKGKKILKLIITPMNELPLTSIKAAVETQESCLKDWLSIQRYLEMTEKAEEQFKQGAKILKIVEDIDEDRKLSKLPIVKTAVFDSYDPSPHEECLPGTRVEILQSIMDWVDGSSGDPFFWLNGMAGTGKSTISRSLARSMEERGILGASFFFKRGESDRANLSKFISTIARQLADVLPGLRQSFIDAASFASSDIPAQFQEILVNPLSRFTTDTGQRLLLVIVIDALDECDDGNVKRLIQLLPKIQGPQFSIDLRIFLTSRPEDPVARPLARLVTGEQTALLHKIDESTVKRDILSFFEKRLVEIRDERKDDGLEVDWPGQENINALVKMSVPLFISAATICRELGDTRFGAKATLSEILASRLESANMAAIYLPVLNKLTRGLDKQRTNRGFTRELLNKRLEDVIIRIKSVSSVLQVSEKQDEPVRVFHKSFRDFMLDPETKKNGFGVDEVAMHEKMTLSCIRVMKRDKGGLKKNICHLDGYGALREDIKDDRIADHLSRELQYACRHWVDHLQKARLPISDNDAIHSFLQSSLLPWFEAMCILGYLDEVLQSLDKLQSFVSMAEEAPLQLYASGLVFSPSECTVRNAFQVLKPQCITQMPLLPETNWGPLLQTIEQGSNHTFNGLVEFSPDGLSIAAASQSAVVLWNTATGSLQQILEPNGDLYVTSFTFSSKGKMMAIAQVDRSRTSLREEISLWDLTTGIGLRQHTFLQDHVRDIYKLAFSPNGEMLASSSGETTTLWNLNPPILLQTLEEDREAVLTAAFSPDRDTLSSASGDGTVYMWNTLSRPVTRKDVFKAPEGFGELIAISHNTCFLLTKSTERRVLKLWDLHLGKLKHTLTGINGSVESIAFSPDGRLCLAGCRNGEINMWDTFSGMKKFTLKQADSADFISLSPDSRLLASINRQQSMRLWEMSQCGSQQDHQEGHSDLNYMLFSPDQTLLASEAGSTITLWDSLTGKRLYSLLGGRDQGHPVFSTDSQTITAWHMEEVRTWSTSTGELIRAIDFDFDLEGCSLALSADGTQMASGFADGTIIVSDIASGKSLETIQMNHEAKILAFSRDKKQLAAGNGKTISIWDNISRKLLFTLQFGSDDNNSQHVVSIAFSPDSRLIAACSSNYRFSFIYYEEVGIMEPQLSFSDDQIIQMNSQSYTIGYDEENGVLDVSPNDCDIQVGSKWIEYKGEEILRATTDYDVLCHLVRGNLVALAMNSGQVFFIGFQDIARNAPGLM
ncbi:uncharacterized protein N7500_006161 [Penicillium coprophilum]|uniref:uncharacterized protein n=1 Tax=Penicillium coprophilum TaxID=36646 RepID=UPI00239E6CF3|nr:uncharacterized protein N7500_006161 [Penicillium coprophilum]KAJ5164331.1 hypothetical protein N7500_006161 [Penicillium coprophilum]